MSNLNAIDPNALETVTGGARILNGAPTSLNNNYLAQTVWSLNDAIRGIARQQNKGLFGGNLFGGNGFLTALVFSRLFGPRPF